MNMPKTSQQLTAIYALNHQELFELVKLMAFRTTWICHMLQGNTTANAPSEQDIAEAVEFAASLVSEAVEEAKQNWKPTPFVGHIP